MPSKITFCDLREVSQFVIPPPTIYDEKKGGFVLIILRFLLGWEEEVACLAGFEPAANGFEAHYSIQTELQARITICRFSFVPPSAGLI